MPDCRQCEHKEPLLLEENTSAVNLVRFCQTQMRSDFGVFIGLDYNAVYHVAASLSIKIDAAMLEKIAALETVMLQHLNRKKPDDGKKKRKR